ncbi:MAG: methyl-accepting chemotaxis protein [Lachnospiraceae bacterium]|nr:methyl-accepting chemotaxis protein [Lachnospiraceae bacterium]
MLRKLDGMKMKQRLNFGYWTVIILMIISGILSMIGLGTLYFSLNDYVNGSQRADTAVKMCRIYTNVAARNIREMVLEEDESTYAAYRQTVEENIEAIGTELEAMEATGLLDDELYQKYSDALGDWGAIGYAIMTEVEAGNSDTAREMILTQCAPALDNVVVISKEIDEITDELKNSAVLKSKIAFITGMVLIVLLIVIAAVLSEKIGDHIIKSITEPLSAIETVSMELSEGNLHSRLEYHSEDEIGVLAHSLRKSIRILGTYVDDISNAMSEFSNGNFDVQPNVDWKGDFVGIRDAFMSFEKSMASTVKGIHSVADQVKSGAEQVSASSMDLAEGATEQAGITQELAATIESVAGQVSENAENAKEISKKVENVGAEIVNGDDKVQEMVKSMSEINEASQEISKIISTINEIASQTNLLALNASIEAARAGEAGKGFAVVADQVSMLAAQSAEAAKESAVLIETSVRAVEKGMVIANDTAKQLESVVKGSKVITEDVNSVAAALEAQMEAFNQINAGVEHINDVVQTNSATSEECAAASQEMNSQAGTLEEVISRFRVAEFTA